MPDQELQDLLYKLTWEGRYWGKDGAIAVSKKLYRTNKALGGHHALSGLSSTYYSAAGNAVARAKRSGVIKKFFWFFKAWSALRTAGHLSDRLEREVGIKNLSPDELDIRLAILRNLRRYSEAIQCGEEALSRSNLLPDTQVLLKIGIAETIDLLGIKAFDTLEIAQWSSPRFQAEDYYNQASLLLPQVKPTTSVRFYRSLAHHYSFYQRRSGFLVTEIRIQANLQKALKIAEDNKLGDQIEKIKAQMAQ